jgi:hypothetical protein
MAQHNIRSARRHRHEGKALVGTSSPSRSGVTSRGGRQTDYATAGQERDSAQARDPRTDPKTLSDFDPKYGHTSGTNEQAKGGVDAATRETYGRGGEPETTPKRSPVIEGGSDAPSGGEHPTGYGTQYGQGFGVGAHHGVQSDSSGLSGGPRERDYRGNAGMTYGATVGPDALKEDTTQDKRPDDKPE